MAKPANKEQLIAVNHKELAALEELLAGLTPEQFTTPGALGDWSVKDVLAHLLEWQHMLQRWFAAGQCGENPAVPAEGFNWAQLPALNQAIFERYRDAPLDDILREFRASAQAIDALAAGCSEEDLFKPGLYPWMRKNTLAAYINSSAGSHYRWARNEMRKNLRKAVRG